MVRKSNDKLLDDIFNVIARHENGVLLSQIALELSVAGSQKRTLQRRIQQLLEQEVVTRKGSGRATRYFVHLPTGSEGVAPVPQEGYIPLSQQGEAARHRITQPLDVRRLTSHQRYNQDFLFDYVPNKSFYLKPQVREHLKKIGKQPDGDKPAATFANQILSRLLVDLSWNSCRLEGNTYSLLETQRLVEFSQAADGKAAFETRMVLNHKAAIKFLVALGDELGCKRNIVLNLHALLSYNLLGDPSASGRLRQMPVSIGKTVYQPVVIPQLIEDYFQKILETADSIADPFEQSFFMMVHLPYLQPFVDVNKRVSRLSANIPLIKQNCCPISFVDVPKQAYIDGILSIYELNDTDLLSDVYVWAYERSTLRYLETRAYLTQPDMFVERYEPHIKKMVLQIVREKVLKAQITKEIVLYAENHIQQSDRARFLEMVETAILALHEGNIVQYEITPAEWEAWEGS